MNLKKCLAALLALCMVFSLSPFVSYAEDGASTPANVPAIHRGIQRGTPVADYVFTVEPVGKDYADFYSMTLRILDARGNTLYQYDMAASGEYDQWDAKKLYASFDGTPATIRIDSMYKWNMEGYTYEQLTYEAPFSDYAEREPATGYSPVNDPGEEILFCRYSIENTNGPLHYVDAQGNPQIQEDAGRFSGSLNDHPGNWYALRGQWEIDSLMAEGDCNLVLCDDSSILLHGAVSIDPGSSLTIWAQREGTGSLTVKQKYADQVEFCGPGIDVPIGASLTVNGGNLLVYGGYDDAAIGSLHNYPSGSITINGGHVEASKQSYQIDGEWVTLEGGAGIGGGDGAQNGPITINGGTVKALGGRIAPGIGGYGSACDMITINGGSVYALGGDGGAGIGGGKGRQNGPITINGGIVEARAGDRDFVCGGAGIGGGEMASQGGAITINGGEVYAYAISGAGIGGGGTNDGNNNGYDGADIIITDGMVFAMSQTGAGIGGGGAEAGGGGGDGGNVTIDGGVVFALSTDKGAGIGGGNDGNGGTVTINGGYVTATGGYLNYNYWEIGLSKFAPSPAEALNFASVVNYCLAGLIFSGKYGGAGIGGGDDGSGGSVTINGGTVIATAGKSSAQSVGKGDGGSSSGSIMLYDNAQVTYGHLDSEGDVVEEATAYGPDAATFCKGKQFSAITPGPCSVIFDVGSHGTAPQPQTVQAGETVKKPADPAAEGYYFAGWFTDESRQTPYDFSTPVNTLTLTLYGKWLEQYTLTITEEWPAGAQRPQQAEIRYINNYADERSQTGSIVLNEANNWTASVSVSEQSNLTLTETPVDGFAPVGWTLFSSDHPATLPASDNGTGRLFLHSREESGLTAEEYDQALQSVRSGNARVTLKHCSTKVFSVRKVWSSDVTEQYRPENISAVLQYRDGSSWVTLETVTLSGDNAWQADFSPVLEGAYESVRIRELDRYGSVVLAADDEDNESGQVQTAAYGVRPYPGGERNVLFDASYAESGDMTVITNSVSTLHTVSCIWMDENGELLDDSEVPDWIVAELFRQQEDGMHGVDTEEITAEEGWFAAFDPQNEDFSYVARVTCYDEDYVYQTVYDASDGEGTMVNKAAYFVTKDGVGREFAFSVSYTYDAETHHTLVTLTRYGICYRVTADYVPDQGRVYAVYAALQHRTRDEQGVEQWVTLQTLYVPQDRYYPKRFDAVPINSETPEDSYRIREVIDNNKDHYGSGFLIDPDEPDLIDLDGTDARGLVLFDADDADNIRYPGQRAQFTHEYHYWDTVIDSFAVSYFFDEETGTMRMINTKMDQFSYSEPEWVWNADCTEAAAVFSAVEDPLVKQIVTAGGDAITAELISEPACETEGETVYRATVTFAGAEYTDAHTVVAEALGHDYVDVVTAPTLTEQGYTTHTCSRCGRSYIDDYTDALGCTVSFSVPEGVTAPMPLTCLKGDSVTLPSAGAPDRYTFLGWVREEVDNVLTMPDVLTGSFPATADVTLMALYARTDGTEGGFKLVTSAPDGWEGSYVITCGKTDGLYVMNGLVGTKKYESTTAGGAVALADSSITLNGEMLTDVDSAYIFRVTAVGDKFTVQNMATGTYLASRGSYLYSYKTEAVSYCRWSLAMDEATIAATNAAGNMFRHLCFSEKHYFMIGRSADTEIFFWKLTEPAAYTVYTTVIR